MPHSQDAQSRLRVLIVDPHEVSRAAIRALLLTEGLAIVADVADRAQAIAAGYESSPDVALIDISEGTQAALETADALARLPAMPTVVLTSSKRVSGRVDGYPFLAKPDVCERQLRLAIRPDNRNP
jgi:DNA-binding NarL/FixJ family response regulator